MEGVGLGSLHSSHAYRSGEASRAPASAADGQPRRIDCGPSTGSSATQRQALYQSVVLVLREKFPVSGQAPAPVAGLTPAEQADNQLAATLGAALNASADVRAEQVGAAVEVGLQQALGSLAGGSTGPDDLGNIAADIRSRVQSLVSAFMSTRDSGATDTVTAARITTKERGVLEIHTLEGDVVKIDFRNSTSLRLGSTDGTSGTQDSLKVRISERTSLQVEGDLNPAELAAIGDLVRKVDTLANEFFAGDVEQAFAAAADLKIDGSQLADYSLQLSMSQKVRIRTVESPVTSAPVLPPSASDDGVVAGSPAAARETATALPALADSVAAAPAPPDVAASSASDAAATKAPAAEDAAVANVQQIIGSFIAKLRANFSVSATDAGLGMTSSIKLSLLAAVIETHSRATPGTQEATSALMKAVDQAGA
ncbi:MAG: hypothetical protein ABL964_10180 [Steroidobacteraceae bacterium]